jgi:hypothetical protein
MIPYFVSKSKFFRFIRTIKKTQKRLEKIIAFNKNTNPFLCPKDFAKVLSVLRIFTGD